MTISFAVVDLSTIAAWIGAVAGSAALVWQIATWRRSTHNVWVERTQSWLSYSNGELSDTMVCVAAINIGAAPVTLTSWGISLGRTRGDLNFLRPVNGSMPLPHRLDSGAQAEFFIPASELVREGSQRGIQLSRMRGWVRLATGKRVYAKRGVPATN